MHGLLHGHTDAALLFGRVAIAALFIPAGLSKLGNLDGFIASLDGRGVPLASILGPLGAEFEGSARQTQQSQFFKNLAIVGGYVFLMVSGGGRYAVDRLWRDRRFGRDAQGGRRSTSYPHSPT